MSPTILITVDLEDWFQVENLRPSYPQEIWGTCESRIERSTRVLLDLFDAYGVRVTFFVLGWVAQRFPGLILEVRHRGHEIASHGYGHLLCSESSGSALREDISKSKVLLEQIAGQPVTGYRAPSFSITMDLIETLTELGFEYDSSYNSFGLNKRYGKIEGLLEGPAHHHRVLGKGIVELEVSNLSMGGWTIPWGGGGYFRLWPTALFEAGVSRLLAERGLYIFYCHPWEFDPGQPRVNTIGKLSRFRHYLNLDTTVGRLSHFLHKFSSCNFVTCAEYLQVL